MIRGIFHTTDEEIVSRYGPALALEFFGVRPIAQKEIAPVSIQKVQKVELNQDAVLALETLGEKRNEAKRQVAIALGISPNASTEELILLCLKGK